MRKFVVIAGIAALLAFATSGQTSHAQSVKKPSHPLLWRAVDVSNPPDTGSIKTLRFVTSTDYPPFNYLGQGRRLSGLNIELMQVICTELKIKCTVRIRKWQDLITSLKNGESDAAIAGLAITADNLRQVSFTKPYFRTPARFATGKTGKLKGSAPMDMVNAHIGVIKNSTHAAYLKAFYPRANLVSYADAAALRGALVAGNVDAIFGDGVQLAFWLAGRRSKGCCKFLGGAYTESRFFGAGMAIAVGKENDNLAQILNFALAKISLDGRYARLVSKHIPLPLY